MVLLALALVAGALAPACAQGEFTCDDLCQGAGYNENAEEQGYGDGSLECACGGLGVGIPLDDCGAYCEATDYPAAGASVTGDSCVCAP